MGSVWKKVILLVFYILLHITVIRQVRTSIFQQQVSPQVIEKIQDSMHLHVYSLGSRVLNVGDEPSGTNYRYVWHYKMPFGSFFFIGVCGLIVLGAGKPWYLSLIICHAATLIIWSLILLLDFAHHTWLLVAGDLISRYLLPLASIGIIPVKFMQIRMNNNDT